MRKIAWVIKTNILNGRETLLDAKSECPFHIIDIMGIYRVTDGENIFYSSKNLETCKKYARKFWDKELERAANIRSEMCHAL